jgi:hypothetical protein
MFFKKQKAADLQFVDISEKGLYQTLPVMKAVDVPYVCEEYQIKTYGSKKFHHCPGMSDYYKMGYIIPAWTDLEFFANKAGITACAGVTQGGARNINTGAEPVIMDSVLPDGLVDVDKSIKTVVHKFENPWHIICEKEISALLLPPIYHATWCNNIHLYPGCISYKKFTAANVMLTVKTPGRFTIKAGEPLLHVIPFWDKTINAGYGPVSQDQHHYIKGQIYSTDTQFYRKKLNIKRLFGLNQGEM